jgi:chromosomal replication initiation ATPase DnaA
VIGGPDERPRQLPFSLALAPSFRREDFVVGASNGSAWALVERWPDWPHRVALVVGGEGTGKSHLASIWAEAAGAGVVSAHDLADRDPVSLVHAGALVVEDCDRFALDEAALFHLLNAGLSANGFLLLSARVPPSEWTIATPDLASRLRAIPPTFIGEPEDELLQRVLTKLFRDRQIAVDPTVVDYLVRRMERSFRAGLRVVEALDREALARGRAITRPMAAEVLFREGLGDADGDDDDPAA